MAATMMQIMVIVGIGVLTTHTEAMTAVLGTNTSSLRAKCAKNPNGPSYGNDKCRCVGMDNLKGYYALQEDFHHVQHSMETGASCAAWDKGMHPKCRGTVPPQWCTQKWCYVDPCSCDLEIAPKQTVLDITYQGSLAYWSYNTCGSTDFYSQGEIPDACVNQKTQGECSKQSKCAWNGQECADKGIAKTCTELAKKDETAHGLEDCRCVGLGGKETGKAFLYVSDNHLVEYPANVGATCGAWESTTHPDCLKDGAKPAWCAEKWCFVDPCKCKTATPPMAVMPANRNVRFQGKTAYWTYATCGSTNSWVSDNKGSYCISQESEAECVKLDKCAWDGKSCLGKALVDICARQEATGVLGVEAPLPSGALSRAPLKGLFVILAAVATMQ
jgi:hypothetical protein